MSKARIGNLEQQIESLVREHVASLRRTAEVAVDRAFSRAGVAAEGAGAPRKSGPRRVRAELSSLSERLYTAICAHPGAGMGVLAAALGATPRELNRPATHLRRAGRVRSVGQRQTTRYFPMANKTGPRS